MRRFADEVHWLTLVAKTRRVPRVGRALDGYTQGRPLSRALFESGATIAALLLAVVVVTALRQHHGLP